MRQGNDAMPWPVVYYRQSDGSEPADEFIRTQPPAAQAAIDNYIERLALFGPRLGYPSTSQVDGELRELRPDLGNIHYRLLYRRTDNVFVILHAFIKPGGRIAQAEIDVAHKRWDDLRTRMNAVPRRRPRALGHDAPGG